MTADSAATDASAAAGVRRQRRWRWLTLTPALIVLLMARVFDPGVVQDMRRAGFDLMQQVTPRATGDPVVRVVDIDERSLAAWGQWPWPRSLVAELVDASAALGAAAIGVDIIFPEADRFPPQRPGYGSNDEILAGSLARHGVVIGFARAPHSLPGTAATARRTPILERGSDPRAFLDARSGLLENVATLEQASAGQGLLSFTLEGDGMIRQLPGVVSIDGVLMPSLGVEMLRRLEGRDGISVETNEAGVHTLEIGTRRLRTSPDGQLWVHFGAHDPDRFVSAADVLAGTVAPEALRGKPVLIGSTAAGLGDTFATPAGAMSGVEIHAQLLENALTGALLWRGSSLTLVEILVSLALGSALIFASTRVLPTSLITGALVIALATAAGVLFARAGVLFDASFAIATLTILHLGGIVIAYLANERARRELAEHTAAALKERDTRLSALRGELLATSRITAVQQYAASLGHELNQPLTAIANYVQTCRRLIDGGAADPAQTASIMTKTARQVERATTIIRGLRDGLDGGVAETAAADINDLVAEACDVALDGANSARVEVAWHLAPDLPPVEVNKVQLQQVVFNLVRNAADATAGAAERRLTVATAAADDGAAVEISVADNGPGISAVLVDDLFQPFASTKTTGMGMGLAICRNIVERHGGRIWADKDAAAGAVFRVRLPAAGSPD